MGKFQEKEMQQDILKLFVEVTGKKTGEMGTSQKNVLGKGIFTGEQGTGEALCLRNYAWRRNSRNSRPKGRN